MTAIELTGVVKGFGDTEVLKDVSLVVEEGSVTAILGESGSGKTTLLRVVAGFETVSRGTVSIAGRLVDDGRRSVHAQHRGVGYVPQEGALFPHLTVAGNIGFGLPRNERKGIGPMIDLVGLTGLDGRYPNQLSGGQQQRVALARALATRPQVILLDEPFSSLDASMRTTVRRDVSLILKEAGTTSVIVTHDQDEALALADEIAVLRDGQVVAFDSPRHLYEAPPDEQSATYIGEANVLVGDNHGSLVRCALGEVPISNSSTLVSGRCRLLLRPEQVDLLVEEIDGAVTAVVDDYQYFGHDALASVSLEQGGQDVLLARISGELSLKRGQRVWVRATGSGRAVTDVVDP
jgi:iron(III) transport system ATP-binding protein